MKHKSHCDDSAMNRQTWITYLMYAVKMPQYRLWSTDTYIRVVLHSRLDRSGEILRNRYLNISFHTWIMCRFQRTSSHWKFITRSSRSSGFLIFTPTTTADELIALHFSEAKINPFHTTPFGDCLFASISKVFGQILLLSTKV